MWMDIVAVLIFTFSTTYGFRQGFVRTSIHSIGWILAIIIGFILHSYAYELLRDKTNYYDVIFSRISDRIALEGSYATGSFVSDMPAILHDIIDPIVGNIATTIATGISDFIFKLMVLAFMVLIARLIIWVFTFIFSKKRNRGVLGFFDGFLGFIAGMIRGLLIIFLILALLVPFVGLSTGDFLTQTLNSSRIAGVLYDNNYLLLVVKGIFI